MSRLDAPSRFDAELAGGRPTPWAGPVGVDEVRALQEVDVALLPAEADLAGLRAVTSRFWALRASDDLRLPWPPHGVSGGRSGVARLGELISTLEGLASDSTTANPEAVERMLSVLEDLRVAQAEVELYRSWRKA